MTKTLEFIDEKTNTFLHDLVSIHDIIKSIEDLKAFPYNLTKEESEAYEACVRLKTKAPYINLRCERLKEASRKNGEKLIDQGIKLLSRNDASTRKVDKIQELKLRNLLIKLASENILRKD